MLLLSTPESDEADILGLIVVSHDAKLLNLLDTVCELGKVEQAQRFNTPALQDHEVKIRLNRFLFTKDDSERSARRVDGSEP